MDKRVTITVIGRVQKAGFREFVDEKAFELGLRGYVKNLDNGTVEIVCEGSSEKIMRLAEKVNIQIYPIRVDRLKTAISEPTGEFKEFEIIPDPRMDGDLNGKLGIGIMLMRALDAKQDRSLETQDATLGAIKTMDSDIKAMDSNIGGHFDKLDAKYDRFGSNLAQVADDIHDMKGDIHEMKGDMNLMKGDMTVVRGDITEMKGDLRKAVAGRNNSNPS